MTPPPARRRPQWRGERQALLVRLPVRHGLDVRQRAANGGRSVSDVVAELLLLALAFPGGNADAGRAT